MVLAIVVPCYNEQEVITETTHQLTALLDSLLSDGHISEGNVYLVDDGSKDKTWSIIEGLSSNNSHVHGLKLAHNTGHQNALWAGLEYVSDKCDAAVSIDADLQDDVRTIIAMVDKFANEKCDVVYGVRKERKTDTAFKRTTALAFYKFMQGMGVEIVYNHADFRLMSRRAIEALMQYTERNIFLRGIVPMIGFKSGKVYYDRTKRFAGESKYPLKKMISFALDGITSFFIKPLLFIATLGVVVMILSLFAGIYVLISFLCGSVIKGWTSMFISIWFLGGVQLLCIGVLGEYIGKVYKEVKRRPRYVIEKKV